MLQQIEKPRDAEAVLLARAYALILSWSNDDDDREGDAQTREEKNDDDE